MKEYIITDDFLDDTTKKFASAQGKLHELVRCKDCRWFLPNEEKSAAGVRFRSMVIQTLMIIVLMQRRGKKNDHINQ